MNSIKNRLIEKGWNRKEISKTLRIIDEAKANKNPRIKALDRSVYWISLLVITGGNFIVTISLIPVLLALGGYQLYLVVATLAISFGLMFELLIRTIEQLSAKHHIFLSIIVPLLAVINFLIISDGMKRLIGLENSHNAVLIGIAYAVSFILPYSVYQLFLKNKH
jgi:hypothetical protein